MRSVKAVDLFAGWGGFTLGAERAGAEVVWAANHWPLAVRAHASNHPRVEHVCQDLQQADWTRLPRFGLLLASPACQGHSEAGQPGRKADRTNAVYEKHDAMRATAWAVIACADVTEPEAIVVENVPAFARWRLYADWCGTLRSLGYHVQTHVLMASRFDVPQRRERLFVVATKKKDVRLDLRPRVEVPFGPSVDWDEGEWRPVAGASSQVRVRIARAQRNYGPRCLSQHVTGHPGVSLDEPIRTITTKDQWCVVDGDLYRPLTVRENARAMGFPDDYVWPKEATRRQCIVGLGNAVPPPLATEVVRAVLEAA